LSLFLAALAHDLPGLLHEFGRTVTYTPAGGTARELLVIVGEKTVPADVGEIASDGLEIWIRALAAGVPELAQGDAVTIGTAEYTVDGIEYDRGGTVLCTLVQSA